MAGRTAMLFLLLMLLEKIIFQILLIAIEGARFKEYHYLDICLVCSTFRRLCDDTQVLHRLSLRKFREKCSSKPTLLWHLETRFRQVNHPEAKFYVGMERLMMMKAQDSIGLRLLNQLVDSKNSDAAYFMAMLRYRSNPVDPEALALIQGISGGPSSPGGRCRWENGGLRNLHYNVRQDLHHIARQRYLLYHNDDDELVVEDPFVCTWPTECRCIGPDDGGRTGLIQYCTPECRIRHEFELFTQHMSHWVRYTISRMLLQ